MEHVVYPRAFNVQPGKMPSPAGEVPVVSVIIQDVGGDTIRVVFGGGDWEAFQAWVAAPEEAAKRAQARSKIISPAGLAPTLKERKH